VRARAKISELVEGERLRALGPEPSVHELRKALPRGWLLEADRVHARRDLRLFFREGWMLALCLLVFGALGALFLLGAAPRGWSGVLRLIGLVAAVALAGGIAGPVITRALRDRR